MTNGGGLAGIGLRRRPHRWLGLSAWFEAWVNRRHRPWPGPIRLHRRRVYILPTRHGYAFAAMALILLLWSINYSNNMGFALTFLLVGVALNAMWRTNRNLVGLRIHPALVEPVFAGHKAHFCYRLDNPDNQTRYGIGLQWRDRPPRYTHLPAGSGADLTLSLPATRRGVLRPGRLRLLTRFPLGLFQAWSWVEFDESCLVYPRPNGDQALPVDGGDGIASGGRSRRSGSEDYAGLRGYTRGDSPRRLAWKAMARRDGEPVVKQFAGQTSPERWLDWDQLPSLGPEQRLSQLCRWVLEAEADGRDYGLRLPSVECPPESGFAHRRRCLEALALFGNR